MNKKTIGIAVVMILMLSVITVNAAATSEDSNIFPQDLPGGYVLRDVENNTATYERNDGGAGALVLLSTDYNTSFYCGIKESFSVDGRNISKGLCMGPPGYVYWWDIQVQGNRCTVLITRDCCSDCENDGDFSNAPEIIRELAPYLEAKLNTTPTTEKLGFKALFAIAGLLAVAYLVLRIKK